MRAAVSRWLLGRPGDRRPMGLWSAAAVLVLVVALAPAVLASDGDHGACGTDDWVKFDVRGQAGFDVEWSREAFTPLPSLTVTREKEGEPISVEWVHEDADEPVWVVDAVWLKAGSEASGAGLIGPFVGGTEGTATTVGATPIPKGISFVLFCFEEEPTDEPTTEEPTDAPTTEEPTDEPTTEEPTDAPTTEEPTDAPTTEEPTEPDPTDTEGVLPEETETPVETETPIETQTPRQTETPTVQPDEAQVLGESTELPHTGAAAALGLLAAGLVALAGGTALVRRGR